MHEAEILDLKTAEKALVPEDVGLHRPSCLSLENLYLRVTRWIVSSHGQNLPEYKPISLNETTQKELCFSINLCIGFLRGGQKGVIYQLK